MKGVGLVVRFAAGRAIGWHRKGTHVCPLSVLGRGSYREIATIDPKRHFPCMADNIEKLKGDFALTLEVLRCALRRSQGIQTTEFEVKRANQT